MPGTLVSECKNYYRNNKKLKYLINVVFLHQSSVNFIIIFLISYSVFYLQECDKYIYCYVITISIITCARRRSVFKSYNLKNIGAAEAADIWAHTRNSSLIIVSAFCRRLSQGPNSTKIGTYVNESPVVRTFKKNNVHARDAQIFL